MSITTRPRTIAIATSAAGVAAMLALPFSASAEPACLDWRFAQDALFLNLDNGVRIGVPWLGGTNKVRTTPGASLLTSPDGGRWQGDIDPGGGTYQGDTIKFRINWNQFVGDQHPMSAFTGHIDSKGVASGTMINEKNASNSWTAEGNFTCSARAAEPAAPPPKPADPGPQPAPADQNNATIIKGDVQLFDVPGGDGVWLGDVRLDRRVKVLTRQDDNWVQISNSGVAGHDTGWVWGDYVGP